MRRLSWIMAFAMLGLSFPLTGQEKDKPAEVPKLPEGVIYVALPPGELRMERIMRKDKPLIRLSVDKTVVEARTMFLGDSKGATHFEALPDGIHWVPASGGKGFIFASGGASSRQPGSTIEDPDFYALDKLKAGSVFITSPGVRFVFGPAAKKRPLGREGAIAHKPTNEDINGLAETVIRVLLPPGDVRLENVALNGSPVVVLSVGKTFVMSRKVFIGDSNGALQLEAITEGMHWVPAKGGKGAISNGIEIHEAGSTLGTLGDFLRPKQLKSGSLFVMTPSIRFAFGVNQLQKKAS